MAKSWSEIKNSKEFQSETPETQRVIADEYFNKVIIPQAEANGDDVEEVYQEFSSKALSGVEAPVVKEQVQVSNPEKSAFDTALSTVGDIVMPSVRGVTGAAVNLANTPASLIDSVKSAGAWLGDQIGIGDGTYIPSYRIEAPESLKPQGLAENVMAEAIPFLIGGSATGSGRIAKGAPEKISQLLNARNTAEAQREAALSGMRIDANDIERASELGIDLKRSPEYNDWLRNYAEAGDAGVRRADEGIDKLLSRIGTDGHDLTPEKFGLLDRSIDLLGRNAQASLVGTLAANSDVESSDGKTLLDLGINTLGGAAFEGIASPAVNRILGSRREALTNLSDDISISNDLKAQYAKLVEAFNKGDVSAEDFRELAPRIKDQYNTFINSRGLGSVNSKGEVSVDYEGFIVPEYNALSEKASTLSEINKYGGKVGTQTLREQLNSGGELLDRYGINDTFGERVGGVANKLFGDSSALETLGLREAGLDAARGKASSKIAKNLDDVINTKIGDLPEEFGVGSAERAPYDEIQKIAKLMQDGKLKEAGELSKNFRDTFSDMDKIGLNKADIDELFAINRDLQTVRKFMEKAEKAGIGKETRDFNNLIGRIASLGGLAAVGGPLAAGAGLAGKYATSIANTANVAKGLRDVGSALKGEYSTIIPSLTSGTRSGSISAASSALKGIYEEASEPRSFESRASNQPQVINTSRYNIEVPTEAPRASKASSFPPEVDRLYIAISDAETGGLEDRFIRTRAAESGVSTAYGPAQITVSLMKDFNKKHRDKLTKAEQRYVDSFIRQGERMKKAKDNDPVYGYGGTGALSGPNARKAYARVARKMLQQSIQDNNGDLSKVVRRWRGNDSDTNYFRKVRDSWESN